LCLHLNFTQGKSLKGTLCDISDSGFQQFWLEIQHNKLKVFLLCVVYRAPDCSVSCFGDDFMENYMHALTFGKEIFVTSDLTCQEAHSLSDLCDSLNLTQLVKTPNLMQLIKTPTRVTSQSSSLIDVILASDASLVVDSGVEETHISDHFLVYSKLELKRPKPELTYITCRGYKHYHAHDFVEDLFQGPWYENSLSGDVNEKVEHFDANFGSVLERDAPIKIMKIRYWQCSFTNQEIKHQMRIRDELHKIIRATKLPVDWNKFNLQRNEVKNMLWNAEKAYVLGEISNNNSNKNSLWKVIRKCLLRREFTQPVY